MDAHAQTSDHTKPTTRQQVLLHAVVGSLVLCAVLVPTAAQASVLNAPEQSAAQPKACHQLVHFVTVPPLYGRYVAHDFPRVTVRDQAALAVMNNMTMSANGKQLFSLLGMSRAQAGNLLRQHLSIP